MFYPDGQRWHDAWPLISEPNHDPLVGGVGAKVQYSIDLKNIKKSIFSSF